MTWLLILLMAGSGYAITADKLQASYEDAKSSFSVSQVEGRFFMARPEAYANSLRLDLAYDLDALKSPTVQQQLQDALKAAGVDRPMDVEAFKSMIESNHKIAADFRGYNKQFVFSRGALREIRVREVKDRSPAPLISDTDYEDLFRVFQYGGKYESLSLYGNAWLCFESIGHAVTGNPVVWSKGEIEVGTLLPPFLDIPAIQPLDGDLLQDFWSAGEAVVSPEKYESTEGEIALLYVASRSGDDTYFAAFDCKDEEAPSLPLWICRCLRNKSMPSAGNTVSFSPENLKKIVSFADNIASELIEVSDWQFLPQDIVFYGKRMDCGDGTIYPMEIKKFAIAPLRNAASSMAVPSKLPVGIGKVSHFFVDSVRLGADVKPISLIGIPKNASFLNLDTEISTDFAAAKKPPVAVTYRDSRRLFVFINAIVLSVAAVVFFRRRQSRNATA